MLEPVKPLTTSTPNAPGGASPVRASSLGGPLAHALGIAVAPDVRRQDRLVPLVDVVAHRLADEVVGDREAVEAVLPSSSRLRRT